jgi:hypothetical protein
MPSGLGTTNVVMALAPGAVAAIEADEEKQDVAGQPFTLGVGKQSMTKP